MRYGEGAIGEPYSLPFDQYQRHRLIRDIVDRIRPQPGLLILDVGGSDGALGRFLSSDRVVVADTVVGGGTTVRASGAALPFANATFDVVASCDTLEHVPQAE